MSEAIIIIQVVISVIIATYFLSLLRSKRSVKVNIENESKRQMEKLRKLRGISLNIPLSERTRPGDFNEIIGQKEGVASLCAALCGENPQHVLIYGPPGVGKTCAARLVMEKAKHNSISPFRRDAKFVEMDATCIRYDERKHRRPADRLCA